MGSTPRNTYKALYQQLQKEFRSGVISLPDDREVLVLLIYSALLENRPAAAALEAFETIENSFIDWNELRVSTAGELCELLPMLSNPRNSCERLRQTLQSIFQNTYKFDLEEWRDKGEDAFREYLASIPYVTRFMANYTVSAVFRKSIVPLDEGAMRALRLLELVDVDSDNHEVPVALERAFSKSDTLVFAKMLHELGAMLMDESQTARAMKLLKSVDPASAKRSCIPLVEEEDDDPFQISRRLACLRRTSPMKMNFDADIEDSEEDEFSADEDALEEQPPFDESESAGEEPLGSDEPPAVKRKDAKKAKEPKPAETQKPAPAKKPAETQKPAPAKKPAETKKSAPAKKPAETKKPAAAKKPAETKKPAPAKKPAETKKPAPAKKPVPAKKPAGPKKPAPAKQSAAVKKTAVKQSAPKSAAKPAAKSPAKKGAADKAGAKKKGGSAKK